MTATDRARFFAGEYDPMPKSRIPLRYRGYYGDRAFVYRRDDIPSRWTVCLPEGESIHFTTFDEAIHEAQRLAKVKAERAYQERTQRLFAADAGEHPPIATVQALMQAAWS